MQFTKNDILLYLSGNSDIETTKRVKEWLKESPDNESEMAQYQSIWLESEALSQYESFNTEKAWEKFKKNISYTAVDAEKEEKAEGTKKASATEDIQDDTNIVTVKKLSRRAILGIAASVLLLCSIALLIFWPRELYKTVYYSDTAKGSYTLPDLTKVELSEESHIRFLKKFDDPNSREVELHGEGIFRVTEIANRPFSVTANQTVVEALGTGFLFKTIDSISTFTENLYGLIKFFEVSDSSNFQILNEGDKALFNGDSIAVDRVVKELPPPPVISGQIINMEELLVFLSREYPKEVEIAVNAKFHPGNVILDKTQKLDDIFTRLDTLTKIDYVKRGPDNYYVRSVAPNIEIINKHITRKREEQKK